jgi:hypothetical protein
MFFKYYSKTKKWVALLEAHPDANGHAVKICPRGDANGHARLLLGI